MAEASAGKAGPAALRVARRGTARATQHPSPRGRQRLSQSPLGTERPPAVPSLPWPRHEELVRAVLSLGLSGPGTPCRLPNVSIFGARPQPRSSCPGWRRVRPQRALCSVSAADGRDGVGDHRAHRRIPAAAQAPGALHPLHRPGDLPAVPLLRHQRTCSSAPPSDAPSDSARGAVAGAVRPDRARASQSCVPGTTLVAMRRKPRSHEG